MANNQQLLLGEGAGGGIPNYIEEVFSTYLYTGTGGADLTVTNGIDLSTKGGIVWKKQRNGVADHLIYQAPGVGDSWLVPNSNAALATGADYIDFTTTGFVDRAGDSASNTYTSWTFRKQPKFFDVVTYTGTGSNTTIAHTLGAVPGCIIVKRTDTTADWAVYHRSLANTQYLVLNTTAAAATGATWWNSTTPTSSVFSVGTDASVNASGGTYVAYLYAHDAGGFGLAGTDNVISCGSFTTDGSGYATVNLGYEPQWILYKRSSAGGVGWAIVDSMRGLTTYYGTDNQLFANTSAAEVNNSEIGPTATGFTTQPPTGQALFASSTYIYIAIRRGPMKVPTVGTSVFSPTAPANGTGAATSISGLNFSPDLMINLGLSSGIGDSAFDRLRGRYLQLLTDETGAEVSRTDTVTGFDIQNGVLIGTGSSGYVNNASYSYNNLLFRRAPSFFDVVCYTGNGINGSTQSHNLGVAPEMWIVKRRSTADYWVVGTSARGSNVVELNSAGGEYDATTAYFSNGSVYTAPTSSVIWLGSNARVNQNGGTFVSYLFATVAGVSKVGSYTGNGSSQTIACGFTAGSRFVMIKRTDSTGDWYVWDSARGIVAGNDPHLSLNTTAAEVTTDDSVDTDNSGFIVNQVAATNVNVTSAQYLFLAIS